MCVADRERAVCARELEMRVFCWLAAVCSSAHAFSVASLHGWRSMHTYRDLNSHRIAMDAGVHDRVEVGAAEEGFAAWWEDSTEEVSDRACTVEGKLPDWLVGRLVRNGPGQWRSGDGSRSYSHAFDGLAKLVCFDVAADGVVRFSTRFLRTEWHRQMANGKMPPSVTVGPVTPAWNPVEGLTAALTGSDFDNAPVNIHRLGGSDRWVAVTDAPALIEFDPRTLETRGRLDANATPIAGASRWFGQVLLVTFVGL